MRRTVLVVVVAVVCSSAVTYLVFCRERRPAPAVDNRSREELERARTVLIVQPDPTAPMGQRSHRLVIVRATGGPEGTKRYAPGAEWMEGGADVERPANDLHWTISIPPRSYVLRPPE